MIDFFIKNFKKVVMSVERELDLVEVPDWDRIERLKTVLGIEHLPKSLDEAKKLLLDIEEKNPRSPDASDDDYLRATMPLLENVDPIILGFALLDVPDEEIYSKTSDSNLVLYSAATYLRSRFKIYEEEVLKRARDRGIFSIEVLGNDATFINHMKTLLISNPVGAHLHKAETNSALLNSNEKTKNVLQAPSGEENPEKKVERIVFEALLKEMETISFEKLLNRPDLANAFVHPDAKVIKRSLKSKNLKPFWINSLNFYVFTSQFNSVELGFVLGGSPSFRPAWRAFLHHHFNRLKSFSEQDYKFFMDTLQDFFRHSPESWEYMKEVIIDLEKKREKKPPKARTKKVPKKSKPKQKARRLVRARPQKEGLGSDEALVVPEIFPVPQVVPGVEALSEDLSEGGNEVNLENIPEGADFLFINTGKDKDFKKIALGTENNSFSFKRARYKAGKSYVLRFGFGTSSDLKPSGEVLEVDIQIPASLPDRQIVNTSEKVEVVAKEKVVKTDASSEVFPKESDSPEAEIDPEIKKLDAQLITLKKLGLEFDLDFFRLPNKNGFDWDRLTLSPNFEKSGSVEGLKYDCSTMPKVGLVSVSVECEYFEAQVVFSKVKAEAKLPNFNIDNVSGFSDSEIRNILKGLLFFFSLQADSDIADRASQERVLRRKQEQTSDQKRLEKYKNSESGKERIISIKKILDQGDAELRVLSKNKHGDLEKMLLRSADISSEDRIILRGATVDTNNSSNYLALENAIEEPYFAHCIYKRIRATVKKWHRENGESRAPFENEFESLLKETLENLEIDESDILCDDSRKWDEIQAKVTRGNSNLLSVMFSVWKDADLEARFQNPFSFTRQEIERMDFKS